MFHSCGTGKSNKNFRFAKVDSNFVNFLPYLKDGAVKLYLYYAAAANNDTGESWHSIDTISNTNKSYPVAVIFQYLKIQMVVIML